MLDSEFFPTPPRLISRMLADVDFNEITTVLEPSAGKGDIAAAVDSFEGQESYARVMADPGKYIVEPAGMLQLAESAA